jgi:hypothetical protein
MFRALGRYVALFSALVAIMRNLLATRIAGQEHEERGLLEFALGSMTAEPITNAFFAACRKLADFDKTEQAIEAHVRKVVLEEIKRRNDIVHGDWLFDELGAQSVLMRVKAGSVRQGPLHITGHTAEDLEAVCTDVEALYSVILVFAKIALCPHGDDPYFQDQLLPTRVADALHLVDGKVRFQAGVPIPHWNG